MQKLALGIIFGIACSLSMAQSNLTAPAQIAPTDSIAHAKHQADSTKAAKQLADSLKMEKLFAISTYPYVKGTKWSGVIPVDNPTEIPDPNKDYKLLFELTEKNPDSLAKEINSGLDEVARLLNLHIASGIPAKRIIPVVVIHGPALRAIWVNERYKKKYAVDNPNVKLVQDLQNVGTKFIACGQAMAYNELKPQDLLPNVKVSLTAQTVLSNYQLQGYVLYSIKEDK